MPERLPNQIDPIDLDRIRSGDPLALTEALDRIYNGLNDTINRLAQVAQQSGVTPIYTRLYRTSGTDGPIVTATNTRLNWDAAPLVVGAVPDLVSGIDVGGQFDPAVSTSLLTLRQPGLYAIEGSVRWDANAVGQRTVYIELVGAAAFLAPVIQTADSAGFTTQTTRAIVPWRVAAGGWSGQIALGVQQTSGGNRTVGGVAAYHSFACTRIGNVR